MVIDKICKVTVKGVKLKSKSFFSISYGVLELMKENPKGADSTPLPLPGRIGLKCSVKKQSRTVTCKIILETMCTRLASVCSSY